jgi:tetratricopeptide (TPR) repeat protein
VFGRPKVRKMQQAYNLLQKEKYQEALHIYDTLLEKDRRYGVAYIDKSVALDKMGKTQKALTEVEKALKIFDYNLAYHNKVFYLQKLKKYQKALDTCNKAIEIFDTKHQYNDRSFSFHLNRGFTLELLNREDEALDVYITIMHKYLKANFTKMVKKNDKNLIRFGLAYILLKKTGKDILNPNFWVFAYYSK